MEKIILTKDKEMLINMHLNQGLSEYQIDMKLGGYSGWMRNLLKINKKKIQNDRHIVDDV